MEKTQQLRRRLTGVKQSDRANDMAATLGIAICAIGAVIATVALTAVSLL